MAYDLNSDYESLYPLCETVRSEYHTGIEELLKKHSEVDLHMVFSRVKKLESIERNIKQKTSVKKAIDCGDLVGLRVVCHCESDIGNALRILQAHLNKIVGKSNYKVRTVKKGKIDGYEGLHIIFQVEQDGVKIPCEIQVRTVLQDAWAVQSRRFLYTKPREGDSNRLAVAVSGIYSSCEDLWELVKEKMGDTVNNGFKGISDDIDDELRGVHEQDFVEKIDELITRMTPDDEVDLEDILEDDLRDLQKLWEETHPTIKNVQQTTEFFEEMEKPMFKMKIIGLLAIKKNKVDILKKVLDQFGKIGLMSNGMNGYTSLISIPFAILHNIYYYLGIYALKRNRHDCLAVLLNYYVTWNSEGRHTSEPVWKISGIFAPDVMRSATQTFDRMLEGYERESEEVKAIIRVNKEDLLTYATSFNLLFVMRAMKLQEELGDTTYVWSYPNFGRYYAHRVQPIISRIRDTKDYAGFIENGFEESLEEFNKRAQGRLAMLQERVFGSRMLWSSVKSWDRK